MGYSVLSVPLRMRYTEWVAFDMESATPDFGTPLAPPELYDHRTDLQEDKNAATNPANAAAKQRLRQYKKEQDQRRRREMAVGGADAEHTA